MIRSLLVTAGMILAVVLSACVPAPPPAPPPPFAAATCPDGQPFLQHVQFLPSRYDPSVSHDAAPAPTTSPVAIDPSTSPYATALQNAFLLAPTAFQVRLCSVTRIYVNGPSSCNAVDCLIGGSWGYRAKDGHTYVGITAALWNLPCPGYNSYVYHCFETDLLNTTLVSNPIPPPQYARANAEADNLDMTVLAALAHEVGHLRWYEILNPNYSNNWGKPYDPNPNTFCSGTFFDDSWKKVHKPPKWRYHGHRKQDNGLRDKHVQAPQILDIDTAISPLPLLDRLYQPMQPWATFFGAVTPDEDFVETFKLWVLTNAQAQIPGEGPLRSLPINFVGPQRDIPSDYGIPDPSNYGAPRATAKPFLAAKARCIGQFVM
jgi:hypothetical protein